MILAILTYWNLLLFDQRDAERRLTELRRLNKQLQSPKRSKGRIRSHDLALKFSSPRIQGQRTTRILE